MMNQNKPSDSYEKYISITLPDEWKDLPPEVLESCVQILAENIAKTQYQIEEDLRNKAMREIMTKNLFCPLIASEPYFDV